MGIRARNQEAAGAGVSGRCLRRPLLPVLTAVGPGSMLLAGSLVLVGLPATGSLLPGRKKDIVMGTGKKRCML